MLTTRQGTTLFTAILLLIGTLVVIQLWLVAALLDALLSGENDVLIPGAAASLGLFLFNAGILFFALHFDRRLRAASSGKKPGSSESLG